MGFLIWVDIIEQRISRLEERLGETKQCKALKDKVIKNYGGKVRDFEGTKKSIISQKKKKKIENVAEKSIWRNKSWDFLELMKDITSKIQEDPWI